MSQLTRRLVLVRQGSEARALSCLNEEWLGFSRPGASPQGNDFYSWWNPATARYFPQRQRLPSLDHTGLAWQRHLEDVELAARAGQLATGGTGAWPTQGTGLGWAHPWGTTEGGMASGLEIHLYEGVVTACAASTSGYRYAQLVQRMVTDRQPNVLFDKDGRHTRIAEWVVDDPGGDYMPVLWFGGPLLQYSDPFGITSAPQFQANAALSLGLRPPYEDELLSYEPIDEAHLVRFTRMAKVLAWLGNDALARDDILGQAEGVQLAYSMYLQDNWGPGWWIPTGMLDARNYVDQHPGWGFDFGRDQAWGVDTMCAAYSLGDRVWRNTARPWFDQVIDLVRDGQMDCTGIIEARPLFNVFNGLYRCRQSIEAAIIEHALVGMRESVFRGSSPSKVVQTNEVLDLSLHAMISPLVWSSAQHGPWAMIGVGPFDENQPPYCTSVPPNGNFGWIDGSQIWSSFAYGYEITGDGQFLDKAAEALGGGNLPALMQALGVQGIQNNAALLALAQTQ